MLAESEVRGLTPSAVASMTATAAAERFSLAPKGRPATGYDADLALVDLSFEGRLVGDDLLYRHLQSPFVGTVLRGRVVRTMLRGQTVIDDGKLIAERTSGRLVRPR